MSTAAEPPRDRSSWRRVAPYLIVGAIGVLVIGVLVAREVASIRAGEAELDREIAEFERQEAEAERTGATSPADEVFVRLEEVQRQGPGTWGRYNLDVGTSRWALELPPTDADEAAWAAWEETARPRWTRLAMELSVLGQGSATVRAEIFAPWQDAPEDVPERLLLRLLPILAAAGILQVDVEHAPPALLEDE